MSVTNVAAIESGTAVLSDATTELSDGPPWHVGGVALAEDAFAIGRTGQRRYWPAAVLVDAADMLVGRPLVKNYHETEGQAPADDVIGKVTDAAYEAGVGVVYEGETTDREIAEKVARGYLDVSPVVAIADETYDADLDAMRVAEVAGFRDLAVVADGAVPGNEIDIGPNPAAAAMSANLGSTQTVAALSRRIVYDAFGDGESDESGAGESTDDDADAVDSVDFETSDDETVEGESGADDGDGDAGDGDDDGDGPDMLTRALIDDLEDNSPDKCVTVKDGAKSIPISETEYGAARSNRPSSLRPRRSPKSLDDDPVAQQITGIDPSNDDDDDADGDSIVGGDGDIDVETDPVARQVLDMDG